ncbi:RING/U-box superfamily protein [Forsythia ovata]|uniref:RING/U-box superfamily protein n=1 Tax=Forsythia ovata TaxID=205694 RepID=A0ABD1WVW5_9LAMI
MGVSDHFVLCKAALIFAVTKWLLSSALNILNSMALFSASSESLAQTSLRRNSISLSSSANLKMVKDGLTSTTFGDIQHRLQENCEMSCAVCLNQLRKKSQVWELRNCRHVFHKQCLEKWLSYDGCRLTCPLCRASLQPTLLPEPPQPHWAVERMLYLFEDDLLP